MAVAEIRPDWTIGTLNLTSGSTAFTTTGSMLQTAAIQPGDELITRSGLVLIIASITGQNAGTLMQPCPAGAAGTGQPLRVRFQPDGSRYNGAAAELVQLLSGGNTYSIAGLDGTGGNKGVMLTGVGTAGTFDLTPFSRQLLDDANAEAWLNTLGLTGNSIADMIQDSSGFYASGSVDTDLNNLAPGARGLYTSTAGSANFPQTTGLWFIETQRLFGGALAAMRQTATSVSSN